MQDIRKLGKMYTYTAVQYTGKVLGSASGKPSPNQQPIKANNEKELESMYYMFSKLVGILHLHDARRKADE